ncbi:MAG: hypothetical protein GY814_11465 [Gammaproteobacteria bacterium]|nr:hypothetical protein [Gammaproteobacteria bacterium]
MNIMKQTKPSLRRALASLAILGLLLTSNAQAASAIIVPVAATIVDTWTFSVDGDADSVQVNHTGGDTVWDIVNITVTDTLDFTFNAWNWGSTDPNDGHTPFTVKLYDGHLNTYIADLFSLSPTNTDVWTGTLTAGTYSLLIEGITLPNNGSYQITGSAATTAVPIPAAFWLFGSALVGFIGFGRRKVSAS